MTVDDNSIIYKIDPKKCELFNMTTNKKDNNTYKYSRLITSLLDIETKLAFLKCISISPINSIKQESKIKLNVVDKSYFSNSYFNYVSFQNIKDSSIDMK